MTPTRATVLVAAAMAVLIATGLPYDVWGIS